MATKAELERQVLKQETKDETLNEAKDMFAIKPVEWIVFGFVGLILTAFIGYVLYTIGWKK